MRKYRYAIENLDCANCARKLEEELNKSENFKNVVVNFNTSIISLESDELIELETLEAEVKKIEPEVTLHNIEGKNISSTSNENKNYREYSLFAFLIAIIFLFVSFKMHGILKTILLSVSYILLTYKHFINTVKMLFKNKTINENFLIVVSSLGACLLGDVIEGIMVVGLYTLGKLLEEKAVNKTRKSVKNLLDIKQSYANLKVEDDIKQIDVYDIQVGDILVIKKGEKVPVDGLVVSGSSRLNTSALTGESELAIINVGSKVLSGSINEGDLIEVEASELYENSTVSRILSLMEEATDKKSKTETIVTRVSKFYTPVIFGLAILVTILLPLLFNIDFSQSVYRGLTFLVISCPCAIAISLPLAYFVGIGVASKNNILIKGSNYLDNLMHIKRIIFDKTGTLTTGAFEVKNIEIFDDNYSKDEIINILAKGESFSNHPIAKSIMKLSNNDIKNDDVMNYKELDGMGISYQLDDKIVKVGTDDLCGDCLLEANVHLNINGKHVASITIDDGIKKNTHEAIKRLRSLGIKTYMFTGDDKSVAMEIGKELGIDEIRFEMLPTDKFAKYEEIEKEEPKVAFVGDGINDAPVLRRATIGISMGEIGSAAAIEASDIVLMKDDLLRIITAIGISKYTNRVIKQNLFFAFFVKVSCLVLSVLGLATMWMAVFADTGVTVLAILNSLRLKRYR